MSQNRYDKENATARIDGYYQPRPHESALGKTKEAFERAKAETLENMSSALIQTQALTAADFFAIRRSVAITPKADAGTDAILLRGANATMDALERIIPRNDGDRDYAETVQKHVESERAFRTSAEARILDMEAKARADKEYIGVLERGSSAAMRLKETAEARLRSQEGEGRECPPRVAAPEKAGYYWYRMGPENGFSLIEMNDWKSLNPSRKKWYRTWEWYGPIAKPGVSKGEAGAAQKGEPKGPVTWPKDGPNKCQDCDGWGFVEDGVDRPNRNCNPCRGSGEVEGITPASVSEARRQARERGEIDYPEEEPGAPASPTEGGAV